MTKPAFYHRYLLAFEVLLLYVPGKENPRLLLWLEDGQTFPWKLAISACWVFEYLKQSRSEETTCFSHPNIHLTSSFQMKSSTATLHLPKGL